MKRINLYLKVLLVAISVSACSKDEPIPEPLSPHTEDAVTFNFSVTIDELNSKTRCFTSPDNEAFADDKCNIRKMSEIRNLYMEIIYDNKVISTSTLLYMLNKQDLKKDKYITSLDVSDDMLQLSLTFNKSLDPSKLEFLFSAWFNSDHLFSDEFDAGEFLDYENLETNYIESVRPVNNCMFFTRHLLCEKNDWDAIQTHIVLKRIDSEIIVLTAVPEANAPDEYYTVFNLIPSNQTNIRNLGFPWNQRYNSYPYDFKASCKYYPELDEALFDFIDPAQSMISTTRNRRVWFLPYERRGESYSWYLEHTLKTIRYKDKIYSYAGYTAFLAPQDPKSLKNKESETLNNLLFIMYPYRKHNDDYRDNLYSNHTIYWSVLPMPEGGVKANTRYVYILNEDFPLWNNSITEQELLNDVATRGTNENKIENASFSIIQQNLNEDFSLETIEENCIK